MQKVRKITSLNGEWDIEPSHDGSLPAACSHKVFVPGLVDLAEPVYDWRSHDYHFYRTNIKLNDRSSNGSIILKINQSSFGTDVWLNGKKAGCNISCYTSQEYFLDNFVNHGSENELVVRVGAKHTLPKESAVGNDYEKEDFIPGIWGDVSIIQHGNPRIKNIQVIPHIDNGIAEVRVFLDNREEKNIDTTLSLRVNEKKSQKQVSSIVTSSVLSRARSETVASISIPLNGMQLWTPDNPFLYTVEAGLFAGKEQTDFDSATFGMREFGIRNGDFYLNGKKIYLRGGNIAFHRFLSDPDRGSLPWQEDWIKRILIDIPKEHHFNFFRNHLGQMYNRWYDIADEYGMLLQNEWQFWGVTGTKEQIKAEFTQWLRDNWNHPSIIIWDALNESRNETVENEIIPEMKKLDPTRPWEPVDFIEDHPYIYSLGPVLNDRKIGFTRSLDEIENLSVPSILNEFVWWWIDSGNKPTVLTEEVVERWLGPDYSPDMLLENQCFLAQELVELFRRMKVDAIQPFVYLSNNNGPTAHWFYTPIEKLQPKPVLKQLKNAFAPFGISIELWDRHFFTGEKRDVNIFVFNDTQIEQHGMVRFGITDNNNEWIQFEDIPVSVLPAETIVKKVTIHFPESTGTYYMRAELKEENASGSSAYSKKIAHVFEAVRTTKDYNIKDIVLLDSSDGEIASFLDQHKVNFALFNESKLHNNHTIVVTAGMVCNNAYSGRVDEISSAVQNGSSLILIEPEYLLTGKHALSFVNGNIIDIEHREDKERGGYDSYVFPTDYSHPVWRGIDREHLKMFNGGFGGEVISQHNVVPRSNHRILARCGNRLQVIAVAEIPVGKGRVVISRLQLRGRLMNNNCSSDLYDRRTDPVAQRYLFNLLKTYNANKNGSG